MNKVNLKVLDCTLRDGGYCNQWHFGEKNILRILTGLVHSNIDIIECGFITNRISYHPDVSKYTDFNQLDRFIPNTELGQIFVAMINYGEYDVDHIPNCTDTKLDGLRIAFHKKNRFEAIDFCKEIKGKDYKVFIQAMVSMNYSDEEFIDLIKRVNEFKPAAFYIVDSFGTMKQKNLRHYLELAEQYLIPNISLGFHSHNNFQSAFSNAMFLIEANSKHQLIIDSSIYGMGRGAGNLNTELFINELNTEYGFHYDVKPLLHIMDEVINDFYQEKPWGYSLPNYLSAAHMAHPNYAIFFSEKNTLTIDAIDDIFTLMDPEKALEYDAAYASSLYEKYMSRGKVNDAHVEAFKNSLRGRKLLLIAPGRSAREQYESIKQFITQNNPVTISINRQYIEKTDYIFVSNMRRFKELPPSVYDHTITTTNITTSHTYMSLDYYSLTNTSKYVKDNAGLMAVKLMTIMGCSEVWLAGFDGYDYKASENYESTDMALIMSDDTVDHLNNGLQQVLTQINKTMTIHFVTPSRLSDL